MKRPVLEKKVRPRLAVIKIVPCPARKRAHKIIAGAQMTNYLLEEHPELGE
jgi:hypothetical protein